MQKGFGMLQGKLNILQKKKTTLGRIVYDSASVKIIFQPR